MKNVLSVAVVTAAVTLGGVVARATELQSYELSGFPITPHQLSVIRRSPSPSLMMAGMPASPHQVAVLKPRARLLTTSVGASASELPQWEVNGFPITPHQLRVLEPKNVQESIPAPASPRYSAIIIIQGNGRVHTVQFDIATQEEQRALISALSESPELAARIRASKNILFINGYEPLNANIK